MPNQPTVRIVRIAGLGVPAIPQGNFISPDITIDAPTAVTIEVEARQIPPGTVVQLTIFSEDDVNIRTINTTALDGTLELSTAMAQFTFPAGFSRIFTQAFFTP